MTLETQSPALALAEYAVGQMTPSQVDLIRRTIARGASDDELALFLEQCRRTGLDPFARQIYAIRRKQWNAATRSYEDSQVIQVSIDGFRLVADRTTKYAGQDGPYWCGPDGVWTEVWLAEEPPTAAKLGVYRHDFVRPVYRVALYKAYVQVNGQGVPTSRWKTDPAGMLAKCAEALALRAAFPNDLSGLYATEEMGQADNSKTPSPSETLTEGSFFDELSAVVTTDNKPQAAESPAPQPEPKPEPRPAPEEIGMSLENARALTDSHGKPYGEIEPQQLTYRYNNMRGMLGKVEPETEREYRRKMAAIELLLAEHQAGVKAKEQALLSGLGFPPEDPYATLKKKAEKDPTTAFWMLADKLKWKKEQGQVLISQHNADISAAFKALLETVEQPA